MKLILFFIDHSFSATLKTEIFMLFKLILSQHLKIIICVQSFLVK